MARVRRRRWLITATQLFTEGRPGYYILTDAAFFQELDNYLSDNAALTGIMPQVNHAEASDGRPQDGCEGRTDIIEKSITALGHLYGEIKGAQTAVQLNDGHYVNKKTTESREGSRPKVAREHYDIKFSSHIDKTSYYTETAEKCKATTIEWTGSKEGIVGEYVLTQNVRSVLCGGNEEDDADADADVSVPGTLVTKVRRLTSVYRSSEPDIAVQLCHVCIRVWGSTGPILAPFGLQTVRSRPLISTYTSHRTLDVNSTPRPGLPPEARGTNLLQLITSPISATLQNTTAATLSTPHQQTTTCILFPTPNTFSK
ncbi:hypothetical protein TcasGA2_TC001454 [Tribolium castaneum]|uniref:Uncharacterized protein n=1 Tax=Tribolium castaneum TaxID=7070 RepID=D7EIJ0_TRICA|nr:hypothetical protein TcasGA2_TC001454 [Tribolium castaneum]